MAQEQYGLAKIGGYDVRPQEPAYAGKKDIMGSLKPGDQERDARYVVLFLPYEGIHPDMHASLPGMQKPQGARYTPCVEKLLGTNNVPYGANQQPTGQGAGLGYIALIIPEAYLTQMLGAKAQPSAPKGKAPVRPHAQGPTIDALAA